MSDKHTFRINHQKHRDELIWQLFEKYGKGRYFIDFVKDVLYEVSLTAFRTGDVNLVSLLGDGAAQTLNDTKGKSQVRRKTSKPKDDKPIRANPQKEVETDVDQQETSEVPAESIVKTGFSINN